MTKLIAIDPGPTHSAYVTLDYGGSITGFGKVANDQLLGIIERSRNRSGHMAVEMIASYGMPVGAEVFETCVWIGRMIERWDLAYTLVYRREVKLHLCNAPRAKDGNVRQALLDRWGGKVVAMGSKKAPGPLYGISADVWQALGVAVTWWDRNASEDQLLGVCEQVRAAKSGTRVLIEEMQP